MSTIFSHLSSSSKSQIDLINDERLRLHRLLFFSDNPPNLLPSCIYLSNLENSVPTVIDSGASKSLSPFRDDFISFRPFKAAINGIGATCNIAGIGTVHWNIMDQKGEISIIETEAYFVPAANIRLYSPQNDFKSHCDGELHMTWNETTRCLPNSNNVLSFPYNQHNNLPLMIKAPSDSKNSRAHLCLLKQVAQLPSLIHQTLSM